MARAGFVTRFLELCAVAAFLVSMAACGGGGDGEPVRTVTTVTVSSPTSTPKQGDTVQLTAVARDQLGDVVPGATAAWSSSAAAVATISATGLLQALAGGSVTVTATIDGVPGTLTLAITPRVTTTVTVSSPNASLAVGEAVQLTVVARDQFGDVLSGKAATWYTSDASVATISPSGLLQAVAPGTVVATATIDGLPGSLTLAVAPGAVASVTVSAPTLTPKEGDAVQLTATARDQFGNVVPGLTTTWSVSDAGLAAVSASGLLQTYHPGIVQAQATIAGVSGTVSLTVGEFKVAVMIGTTKEVVFAYKSDHCLDSDLDFPDLPPQVVRAEDGSLVLFASAAPRYYVSRGPDFNSLKRDCSKPVLVSADLPTPQSYENREWISAVYREGNRWHAIISNEYHDLVARTCQSSDPSIYIDCLYLSATYAVSTDGARTFTKPSPPAHVVAPPPNAWAAPPPGTVPNTGQLIHEGYSAPITVVSKGDGFFYGAVGLTPSKFSPATHETCLIRTDNLNDPASWRAWDGSGFTVRMTSPYVTGSPAAPLCKLSHEPPGSNISFNTYLDRYMEVGTYRQTIDGMLFKGVYFSLSADLIHWSSQQLIAEIVDDENSAYDPQNQGLLEPVPVLYVKLIDHADTSVNFERPGRTPYLYYTRFNDPWKDRDLVRVQLTFTRSD